MLLHPFFFSLLFYHSRLNMNPVVHYEGNDNNKATNTEKPINHWAEEDDSDNDSDYTPDGKCLTRQL